MSNQPQYQHQYKTPAPNDGISTLIPYRNVPALMGYYLGIFSIIPILGAVMGIAAVVLGIMGLRRVQQHPEAKGTAHAIVAIICGGLFGLIWWAVIILAIISIIANHR